MAATNQREGSRKPPSELSWQNKGKVPINVWCWIVRLPGQKVQPIILGRRFRPLRVKVTVMMVLYQILKVVQCLMLAEGKVTWTFCKQNIRVGM